MKCLNCGKEVKNKFCNVSCQNLYKRKVNKENYYNNPKVCKNCGKIINFEKKCNLFCSSSCSTSFNNLKRGPLSDEQKQRRKETLLKHISYNNFRKKERICKVCGNKYYYTKGVNTKIVCSKQCSSYLKKHYKEFLPKASLEKIRQAGLKSAYKQKEQRRSKNEIYFCDLCSVVFKDVKNNEPMFNGWDADIIIEKYKIAILWNGVWHYKQIKKDTSLKQIQNRDLIKLKEIQKKGYYPYVIKDMGKYNKNFVEKEFVKFIKHIAG